MVGSVLKFVLWMCYFFCSRCSSIVCSVLWWFLIIINVVVFLGFVGFSVRKLVGCFMRNSVVRLILIGLFVLLICGKWRVSSSAFLLDFKWVFNLFSLMCVLVFRCVQVF